MNVYKVKRDLDLKPWNKFYINAGMFHLPYPKQRDVPLRDSDGCIIPIIKI